MAQESDLLFGLVLHLCAVLAEALELVHELVNHVPKPLVRELHVDDAVEHHLEQAAIVVPRVDPLAERGRQTRVQVAEPHLPVQEAEHVVVVDVVRDGVHGGPRRVLEEAVGERVERGLIHLVDLVHVLLPDVAVQVDNEGFHRVRHEVRVVPEVLRRLAVVVVAAAAAASVFVVDGGHCFRG